MCRPGAGCQRIISCQPGSLDSFQVEKAVERRDFMEMFQLRRIAGGYTVPDPCIKPDDKCNGCPGPAVIGNAMLYCKNEEKCERLCNVLEGLLTEKKHLDPQKVESLTANRLRECISKNAAKNCAFGNIILGVNQGVKSLIRKKKLEDSISFNLVSFRNLRRIWVQEGLCVRKAEMHLFSGWGTLAINKVKAVNNFDLVGCLPSAAENELTLFLMRNIKEIAGKTKIFLKYLSSEDSLLVPFKDGVYRFRAEVNTRPYVPTVVYGHASGRKDD